MSATALCSTAFAQSVGFKNEDGLVHSVKAPYDNKYTNIQWQLAAEEDIGVPVPYGDSVLIPIGNEVLRYNEADGTKMAAIALPSVICEKYSGVMNGDTLVLPLENGLCTIDLTNGDITGSRTFTGSVDSDVAVIDDMAYFSVKNGSTESFRCVQLNDELSTIWEYSAEAEITSPSIQGDYVIFGAGDKLVTCHYKDGAPCDIPMEGAVTSAPFASDYAVFCTVGDKVAKLRLNSDGTLEEDTLVFCKTGAHSSAPLNYNSRLYVCSEDGMHILDSINMEIIHTIPDIKNGTDPIICMGNGTRVYTVASYSEGGMALHSVFDIGENNEPTDKILAVLQNFDGGRYTVSKNGTMYFRDGSGRVYALTLVEYDIVMIVIKLVLILALIVGIFLWVKMLAKRKADSYPKF